MNEEPGIDNGLRDRLVDYVARLHVPKVKPVNGVINICAEDMADVLLPFIRVELNRPRARADLLNEVLAELVELKDGPRDERYRRVKEASWQRARDVLHP